MRLWRRKRARSSSSPDSDRMRAGSTPLDAASEQRLSVPVLGEPKRSIDGPLQQIVIPAAILETTGAFLRDCGRERCEGVVLWIGVVDVHNHGFVTSELIPRQIGYRGPDGVAVSIPGDEITRLFASLTADQMILCRVHSHPGRAYHSSTDDLNQLLSHVGAISIVVPDFARAPIELGRCSINELDDRHRWRELPQSEATRRFMVDG